MASLERTPSERSGTPQPIHVFDASLVAAARRIDALENERAGSNRAINELLLRAESLEAECLASVADTRGLLRDYVAHVDAETERVRAENVALAARLHELQSRPLWRFATILRRLRAKLR